MSDTLVVNEIYLSLQGESAFAGLPSRVWPVGGMNVKNL